MKRLVAALAVLRGGALASCDAAFPDDNTGDDDSGGGGDGLTDYLSGVDYIITVDLRGLTRRESIPYSNAALDEAEYQCDLNSDWNLIEIRYDSPPDNWPRQERYDC